MAQYRQAQNRRASFVENWKWQEKYFDDVKRIVKENLHRITVLRIGMPEQDMKEATDLVVHVNGGTIALRIRDAIKYKYRDLTIRSYVPTGYATEIDKLRQGYGDWYLYAWADSFNIIEYMLVDLAQVRQSGLLDMKHHIKTNRDGTKFIAISADDLRTAGALVRHTKWYSQF